MARLSAGQAGAMAQAFLSTMLLARLRSTAADAVALVEGTVDVLFHGDASPPRVAEHRTPRPDAPAHKAVPPHARHARSDTLPATAVPSPLPRPGGRLDDG